MERKEFSTLSNTPRKPWAGPASCLLAPILLGSESVHVWSAALAQARQAGLLEHPYLRLQLLLMGSFAGE